MELLDPILSLRAANEVDAEKATEGKYLSDGYVAAAFTSKDVGS
jgi:hypothetical protein